MKAAVGDRIVIASSVIDRPAREGKIVEVRHPDGTPPFLVEWSESGRRALIFPGPEAHVVHPDDDLPADTEHIDLAARMDAVTGPDPARPGHVATWHVDVHLFEDGADTQAHAVLLSSASQQLDAEGHAHRRPGDFHVPEIGDEIAAGRALRQLADRLLGAAAEDLAAVEGHPVLIDE